MIKNMLQSRYLLRSLGYIQVCVVLMLAVVVWADGLPAEYSPLAAHPLEQELFEQSNDTRAQFGLSQLEYDETLTLAARHHAAEMARLNYLSHTSPTPATATLYHRVVRAGSTALSVHENLAQVRNQEDSIARSIQGWLDSPGHRANFLDPKHTHIGVALAEDNAGYIYTVQVFAYQPVVLADYDVRTAREEVYQLDIAFAVARPSEVSFFYQDKSTTPQAYQTGRYSQRLMVSGDAPWQLRMGVRPVDAMNSFVLEDEGWVTPADASYAPSHTVPRSAGEILEVDMSKVRQQLVQVTLEFTEALPQGATLFFAEQAIQDVEQEGRRYTFRLPRDTAEGVIDVGLLSGQQRYEIVMQMQLALQNSRPRLSPVAPKFAN